MNFDEPENLNALKNIVLSNQSVEISQKFRVVEHYHTL